MDDIPATTFLVAGRPSAVSAVTDGLKIVVPSKPLLNTLLKWDDVLGANNSQNPTTVTVHTLGKASNGKRYANIVALVATKNDGQQEVERWVQIITFFADPTRAKATVLPCLNDVLLTRTKPRRYMVIVNPASGQSKGVKLFQKVEALFAHANIHVTKVLTERAAHATELATAIDHTQYDALVIVGGDGVIYEVVQGLMQRPDWADVIQIPLAILPAGGGNGLAKSLTESSGEVYSFENCAYLAIKGQPQPLDLATLRSKTATKFIFLSLSWAFLAEMDFESEKYRFAGAQRFTISSLGKILSGKNWSGSFSYVEPTADEVVPTYWADGHDDGRAAPKLTLLPPSAEDPKPETWKTIEGNFSLFWAMNAAWAGTNGLVAPSAEFDDGYMHVVIMPGKVSMAEYMGVFLTLDSGRHVDKPTVQVIKTRYTHR
ncbi:hypothetical protein, variant 2 [Aphanomyces astaci]|uniref:DAGKc domain-containing protein n=1 Tax=Aphanomyces astaci TaxID=112090 RepID=W4H6M4_APHAT|nr:hypothetical protein, variant 1 [Aphanomyces astaci]XP_009822531.1 hypothetical protein, variant 2 [Aphanomyces astaci]ETV87664.1 hypothetical protein, variant 1 [Aphanomyces astaci]ETV87665.1 hypothetical protein, variant 2 [Aphanomyces astaci]|eukprot:XP_009822527.1 hypothetical protein, variant 1 [Aphanomyces astaci]